MADDEEEDSVQHAFRSFLNGKPPAPTQLQQSTNYIVQSENARRLMRKRTVFQRMKWDVIDMPNIWSPHDEERARDEGWAIGGHVGLWTRAATRSGGLGVTSWGDDGYYEVAIGKASGTFTSDDAAAAWVEQQAERDPRPHNLIYRRALAVVAALTIRTRGK